MHIVDFLNERQALVEGLLADLTTRFGGWDMVPDSHIEYRSTLIRLKVNIERIRNFQLDGFRQQVKVHLPVGVCQWQEVVALERRSVDVVMEVLAEKMKEYEQELANFDPALWNDKVQQPV